MGKTPAKKSWIKKTWFYWIKYKKNSFKKLEIVYRAAAKTKNFGSKPVEPEKKTVVKKIHKLKVFTTHRC